MLTKTQKKKKIVKIFEKDRSADRVVMYLSSKFALIHSAVSEETMSTDGRVTTDAHVMTVALLCRSTKQSYNKRFRDLLLHSIFETFNRPVALKGSRLCLHLVCWC